MLFCGGGELCCPPSIGVTPGITRTGRRLAASAVAAGASDLGAATVGAGALGEGEDPPDAAPPSRGLVGATACLGFGSADAGLPELPGLTP